MNVWKYKNRYEFTEYTVAALGSLVIKLAGLKKGKRLVVKGAQIEGVILRMTVWPK